MKPWGQFTCSVPMSCCIYDQHVWFDSLNRHFWLSVHPMIRVKSALVSPCCYASVSNPDRNKLAHM